MSGEPLSVFLSYSFRPKQQAYSRSDILAAMEGACTIAQGDLRSEYPGLRFSVTAELIEYGGSLNAEILAGLRRSHICVVDVSDNNPNVFYELGVLHAIGKRAIVLKSSRGESDYPLPSDVAGLLLLRYETVADIKGQLAAALVALARGYLGRRHASCLDLCRAAWGERGDERGSHIIVAPRSSSQTQFADISSPNYIYLDRLGDKDAVVEISVLLARLYPRMSILRYVSDEIPRDAYEGNLVLVGGPGGACAEGASNVMVKPIQSCLGIPLCYSADCERMIIGEELEVQAEESEKGITRDYGFFARTRNPYNPDRSLVLVHGIHTYGVLGAARAFSDHPKARENLIAVLNADEHREGFWTYFAVDVIGGVAMVPTVDPKRIFPVKEQ